MLTPEQKQLIRESYARSVADAVPFAQRFYANLFEAAPTARPMFTGDIDRQAAKLMSMIGLIVGSIDHIGMIAPMLMELGRSHQAYGVQSEHYGQMAQVFVATLREHYALPPEAAELTAWHVFLTRVGEIMLDDA
jgi:hemoglobin-like flavoprotein